ncbi:MAG TPA: thioesterase domain-containing protein, partial [Polyangiaceae bacterium]|nr:thioesterase domain-containing protein [Polyangiaceae bacterium]
KGLEDGETPIATVEEMAREYVDAIRSRRPSGPYALLGMSFGGTLAFEMARRLSAAGHRVSMLCLIDSPIAGHLPHQTFDDSELLSYMSGDDPELAPEALSSLGEPEHLERFLSTMARRGRLPVGADAERLRRGLALWRSNAEALRRYHPDPCDQRVTFLAAREKDSHNPEHPYLGWIPVARRGVSVIQVPGSHRTLLDEPHVGAVAAIVRDELITAGRLAPEGG